MSFSGDSHDFPWWFGSLLDFLFEDSHDFPWFWQSSFVHHFDTFWHSSSHHQFRQDVAYTCENAQHFFLHHVQYRWEDFHRKLKIAGKDGANIHKAWGTLCWWSKNLGLQNANLTGDNDWKWWWMILNDDQLSDKPSFFLGGYISLDRPIMTHIPSQRACGLRSCRNQVALLRKSGE